MGHFWRLVETAMDAAVPFVAMGVFCAIFASSNYSDPTFVTAGTLYVAFRLIFTAHHQAIGGAGAKATDKCEGR